MTERNVSPDPVSPSNKPFLPKAGQNNKEPEGIMQRSASGVAEENKRLVGNFINHLTAARQQAIKEKHRPIIGWTNTYVPEEILIAAGCLPYRIMGAPVALSLSKSYLLGNLCSSIQSILECALQGAYTFLDGAVVGATTDSTKRFYDGWKRYSGMPFNHLFDVPKIAGEEGRLHYLQSVWALIKDLERYLKIKIAMANIAEAIKVCNKTRALLFLLNESRKVQQPPLSSLDMLEICKLAMTSDKEFFNRELEVLLRSLEMYYAQDFRYRFLLMGSFRTSRGFLRR